MGSSPSSQLPHLINIHEYTLALTLVEHWKENRTGIREQILKLQAFHLFIKCRFQSALEIFLEIDTDLVFVLGLFPGFVKSDSLRKLQYPSEPPSLSSADFHRAVNDLIDFLLKKRQKLVLKLESATAKQKGSLLHNLQVLDTTLLKCYIKERPGLVGPLLRLPDSRVSVTEGERLLRDCGRLPDFLLLLRSRGKHEEAMKILRQNQNTASPVGKPEAIVDYLVHIGAEDSAFVLANSVWLLQNHPDAALNVFTGNGNPISDAEHFPRFSVLELIKEHQPRIALTYLEFIITEWKEKSAALHHELIKCYCEAITEPNKKEGKTEIETNEDLDDETASMHSNDTVQDFEAKLLNILKNSSDYVPTTALLHLNNHERLLRGKAVVLGRMRQDKQVLSIYINSLHDLTSALDYCNQISNDQAYAVLLELLVKCENVDKLLDESSDNIAQEGASSKVFSSDRKFNILLHLLHSHSSHIKLRPATPLLPDGMAVSELHSFLQRQSRNFLEIGRRQKLQKAVSVAISRQSKEELHSAQRSKVLLSNKSCKICQKPLTRYSAFVTLPGGVAHFSCREKAHHGLMSQMKLAENLS